jgi:hypothetical protein
LKKHGILIKACIFIRRLKTLETNKELNNGENVGIPEISFIALRGFGTLTSTTGLFNTYVRVIK